MSKDANKGKVSFTNRHTNAVTINKISRSCKCSCDLFQVAAAMMDGGPEPELQLKSQDVSRQVLVHCQWEFPDFCSLSLGVP